MSSCLPIKTSRADKFAHLPTQLEKQMKIMIDNEINAKPKCPLTFFFKYSISQLHWLNVGTFITLINLCELKIQLFQETPHNPDCASVYEYYEQTKFCLRSEAIILPIYWRTWRQGSKFFQLNDNLNRVLLYTASFWYEVINCID